MPAGTRCPRITFSFNPTRLSTFPASAASVRTFVVSWKLAADRKLQLCTDALVIPSSWVDAVADLGLSLLAGRPPSASNWAFCCSKISWGTMSPSWNFVSPGSVILMQPVSCSFLARNSNLSITRFEQAGVAADSTDLAAFARR